MKAILNAVIACVLFQTLLGASINLGPHEDLKSLTTTSTEPLSSFQSCTVYIFDWAWESDYDSITSTKYIRFYSEYMNCAVLMETYRQYRSSTLNPQFDKLEPHPLFNKHTTILLNLYTPHTTSTVLKNLYYIDDFYDAIAWYNIPFNYILSLMTNEQFSSIDNVGWFCNLATVSSPAVFLLELDEQEVNVIGYAHAFQAAPFLFKVTKFQEAHFQQRHQFIHNDMQGSIAGQVRNYERAIHPSVAWKIKVPLPMSMPTSSRCGWLTAGSIASFLN